MLHWRDQAAANWGKLGSCSGVNRTTDWTLFANNSSFPVTLSVANKTNQLSCRSRRADICILYVWSKIYKPSVLLGWIPHNHSNLFSSTFQHWIVHWREWPKCTDHWVDVKTTQRWWYICRRSKGQMLHASLWYLCSHLPEKILRFCSMTNGVHTCPANMLQFVSANFHIFLPILEKNSCKYIGF